MKDEGILLGLALVFVPFSLTSIGGGGAIIAGIQNGTLLTRNRRSVRRRCLGACSVAASAIAARATSASSG